MALRVCTANAAGARLALTWLVRVQRATTRVTTRLHQTRSNSLGLWGCVRRSQAWISSSTEVPPVCARGEQARLLGEAVAVTA